MLGSFIGGGMISESQMHMLFIELIILSCNPIEMLLTFTKLNLNIFRSILCAKLLYIFCVCTIHIEVTNAVPPYV